MVSFDIVSLFRNVPADKSIEIVTNRLKRNILKIENLSTTTMFALLTNHIFSIK